MKTEKMTIDNSYLINLINNFDETTCKHILESKTIFFDLIKDRLSKIEDNKKSLVDWNKTKSKIIEEIKKEQEKEQVIKQQIENSIKEKEII